MLHKRTQCGLVAGSFVVVWSVASAVHAATWAEVGDTGDLPGTAQSPQGLGLLSAITGSIADSSDADVYRVCLLGGKTFSAITVNDATDLDTQLFLFDNAGFGIYYNDDVPGGGVRSRLSAGNALTPSASGVYYLAISTYNRDPISAGGEIFPQTFPGIFGPTGPGGGSPISGWAGLGNDIGNYQIDLTGTEFCNDIDIDIRPGSPMNTINVKSKGVLPVGILSTAGFDATTIDPDTVCFGDAEDDAQRDCTESPGGHFQDVNGDGLVDLVLHFNTQETGIDVGDTSACLSGETFGGAAFAGCDLISILPP